MCCSDERGRVVEGNRALEGKKAGGEGGEGVGGLCVSEQENAHELRNEMRKGSNLCKF